MTEHTASAPKRFNVIRLYVSAATPPRHAHGFSMNDSVWMAKINREGREDGRTRVVHHFVTEAASCREEAIARAVDAYRERIAIQRRMPRMHKLLNEPSSFGDPK